MNKFIYPFLFCLFALLSFDVLAVEADDLIGTWKTADTEFGYSHIEVYKENGKYQGKIVYLSNPLYTEKEAKTVKGAAAGEVRRDIQNPDKSKRSRELIGLDIVSDFSFRGKQWLGGKVYDPESGKTYKGKMWLNKNGTLGLRGFIGVSVFGRSTTWKRVENLAIESSEDKSDSEEK